MAVQSFAEVYRYDNQPFEVSIGDKDYEGFFSNFRVDKETLPKGWYAYDLREGDDGNICELTDGCIFVNHFGTFCTQNKLPIEGGKSLYTDNNGFDYSFG